MAENSNISTPDLASIASSTLRRTYQQERRVRARQTPRGTGTTSADRSGNSQAIGNQVDAGIIQDGHLYAFDEDIGANRPSAPQLVQFSWPGAVKTGDPSGPHLVVLPNVSRIYMVTLAIGTLETDSDITVDFILNGTAFQALTLLPSEWSVIARNDGSWPPVGGNATDMMQVQCTTAGIIGSDLVAGIRIV